MTFGETSITARSRASVYQLQQPATVLFDVPESDAPNVTLLPPALPPKATGHTQVPLAALDKPCELDANTLQLPRPAQVPSLVTPLQELLHRISGGPAETLQISDCEGHALQLTWFGYDGEALQLVNAALGHLKPSPEMWKRLMDSRLNGMPLLDGFCLGFPNDSTTEMQRYAGQLKFHVESLLRSPHLSDDFKVFRLSSACRVVELQRKRRAFTTVQAAMNCVEPGSILERRLQDLALKVSSSFNQQKTLDGPGTPCQCLVS